MDLGTGERSQAEDNVDISSPDLMEKDDIDQDLNSDDEDALKATAGRDKGGPVNLTMTYSHQMEGGLEENASSPPWGVDAIINLIETGAFTHEKKLLAKLNGRPQPIFIFEGKRQCRLVDQYNNHRWLCGCSKRRALFCFPCLLFNYKKSSYLSGLGLTDLSNFTNYVKKHVKSPQHLSAMVALSFLGNEEISETEAARKAKEWHNLEVKSNREMLKHHIKAAVYLVSQGISFEGCKETSGCDSNRGNFVELVSVLASFSGNEKIMAALANLQSFTGLDNGIQNELIEILYNTVHGEILRRIQNSDYISIIFDELTDVSNTPHLCVSVRLIYEAQIHEHFLDLVDVSGDRSAAGIAEKLKVSLKTSAGITRSGNVIGLSHDGAFCLASTSGPSVQQILQEKWPHAQFVHCHAHKWAVIVCKACENVSPEVTYFLGFVHSLCNFFKASPGRANLLCGAIPGASPTHWLSKSSVIATAEIKYEELVTVLESVSASLIYDPCTRTEANGLLLQLRTVNNVFLLKLFERIISLSDVLTLLLQSKNIDPLIIQKAVADYQKHMMALKTDRTFVEFWEYTANRNPFFLQHHAPERYPCISEHVSPDDLIRVKEKLKAVMIKVADAVLNQLTLRFGNLAHFTGIQFFNPDNFEKLKNDKAAIANSLGYLYPHIITDWESFMSQLTILTSDAKVIEATRSIHDSATLLKFMQDVGLSSALPIVSQALSACLTLPTTAALGDRNSSVLTRVKHYVKSAKPHNRLNHMMFLCVESSVLRRMAQNDRFYDSVIDRFANMKEREINLLYK